MFESDPVAGAVQLLESAESIMITAGAGMGVDSGLPDFRGEEGFWKAYPALGEAGIGFESIAKPSAFQRNPRLAWGFYGHRLALYRKTIPHPGFAILRTLEQRMPRGAFVVTSNVDGQFQKAGFADHRILEIHGSIHYLQCTKPCRQEIWPADGVEPNIDTGNCLWLGDLPHCPYCGGLARPNILMFNDADWIPRQAEKQRSSLNGWQSLLESMVVIELGAGTALPSIRRFSLAQGCPVIRIDPGNASMPPSAGVSLAMGARRALGLIANAMGLNNEAPELGT